MVLAPVIAGICLQSVLSTMVNKVKPLLPLVAVIGIVVVTGTVVSLNVEDLASLSVVIVLAVSLLNFIGIFSGYLLARFCKQDVASTRTIAIEVATQNAAMAAVLSVQHFSVLSALPAVALGTLQCIYGACVAGFWSRRLVDNKKTDGS